MGGGARLRNGATLVEIEPSGVIGFSPDSRNVEINEENGEVRISALARDTVTFHNISFQKWNLSMASDYDVLLMYG